MRDISYKVSTDSPRREAEVVDGYQIMAPCRWLRSLGIEPDPHE